MSTFVPGVTLMSLFMNSCSSGYSGLNKSPLVNLWHSSLACALWQQKSYWYVICIITILCIYIIIIILYIFCSSLTSHKYRRCYRIVQNRVSSDHEWVERITVDPIVFDDRQYKTFVSFVKPKINCRNI